MKQRCQQKKSKRRLLHIGMLVYKGRRGVVGRRTVVRVGEALSRGGDKGGGGERHTGKAHCSA